ncbi:MAG: type II toxin-antitoxin system Phd/YefM family antitoxin [Dehalococcoidia bacterium]
MAIKIVNVSVLKANMASLMAQLGADGVPVYVTQHGKPKAVLVSFERYEALLEKVDDLEDILAMREALSSPKEEAMSLDEYERRRVARLGR